MTDNKFKFSKISLEKLPPPIKRTYFRDSECRNLIIDCQPTGAITFQVYKKFKGAPKRVPLGRFDPTLPDSRELGNGIDPLILLGQMPSLNVRMARAMAIAVNAQLSMGIDIHQSKLEAKRKHAGELTLGQAFERYKNDHLIPNGARTTQDLTDNFNRYLGYVAPGQKRVHGKERAKSAGSVDWEKKKLSEITPEDVRRLMIDLQAASGKHTANRTFELLRTIFNKMIAWRLFASPNPCLGISKFKEESRERFLQPSEVAVFYNHLSEFPSQNFRDYVMLSLFTGARKSNILSMRWCDIDWERKVWTIRSSDFKNKSSMTIPLVDIVIEVLRTRELGREGDWVFPANSASGHMTSPKKAWSQLLSASGIEDLRPHDLRRTLGSYAALSGASLLAIGKVLGHKSQASTQVYARLNDDPIRSTINTASNALLDKVGLGHK